MKKDNVKDLKNLGSKKTIYVYDEPNSKILETFENQFSHRNYHTKFVFNEFTSLCPKTGQPDFATVSVEYVADKKCIETKSLKLYFLSFRQYGSFMETITNQILEDLVEKCKPRQMKVTSNFNPRGGTFINVIAAYEAD